MKRRKVSRKGKIFWPNFQRVAAPFVLLFLSPAFFYTFTGNEVMNLCGKKIRAIGNTKVSGPGNGKVQLMVDDQ